MIGRVQVMFILKVYDFILGKRESGVVKADNMDTLEDGP